MILSRAMLEKDYEELVSEGQIIQDVNKGIEMWNPAQHQHRLWEYAMAQKALKEVYGDRTGLLVSDHGCGAGYLSPILYWLGHNVVLYEPWAMGNEEQYMLEQMRRVAKTKPEGHLEWYEMRNIPMGSLEVKDSWVDAAFCISTIEHIKDYREAFSNLIDTVRPGGLVFLTSDYAEDEQDHYTYSNLRAGKMFNIVTYTELIQLAENKGFHLLGGKHELTWSENNRLVLDYGFGSLALVREN